MREVSLGGSACAWKAGRESILSTLRAIEAIAIRENAESIYGRLLDLRQRIEQDRFQLAVVGQFKRGKTSVLNALLRREVLPAGPLPFTSVLTVVKYGNMQSAEVVFRSGERLPISLSELLNYVTEGGNPGNVKNVEQVEVSYPSERLRDGVTFINCPGFGSPSDRNTHAAYEFLPRVDAAIFVTSPDPPLTLAETEFLKRLAGSTKRIFVVMNKIDLFDAQSLAAILEFTQNAVSTALSNGTTVYAVSARQVLTQTFPQERSGFDTPGFDRLESDLQHFFKKERVGVFYASVLRSLLNSISDLRVHLQLRIESATASSHDFERKRARMEDELNATLQRQQQNEVSLKSAVNRLSVLVDSEVARFARSKTPSLDPILTAYVKDCSSMSKGELAASLSRFMGFQIQHIFDQWRPDFESSLDHAFRDASAKFLKATNDVTDSIRHTAFALFGAELGSLRVIEELPAIHGGTHIGAMPQCEPVRPSFLLPRPIFHWRARQLAVGAAPRELECAGGFVARELKSRLTGLTDTFTGSVRNRLCEIAAAVRLAVGEAPTQHGHPEMCSGERLRRLSTDIDELEQIAGLLHASFGAEYALEA